MSSPAPETRTLPKRLNPHLQTPPPYHELVENRRLGQTNLGEKGSLGGPFSYVHLRVALPNPLEDQELFGAGAPESYFLMRRSKDGFVSSTGMFKASFPWARKVEEEAEKQYVKSYYPKTSKEETAGNLWVDPNDALHLAEEYGIKPWIEALLDNEAVIPSDHRRRTDITPPPPFFRKLGDSDKLEIAPALTPSGGRRRSTRSMSPSKRMTPRKNRAAKSSVRESPLKKEVTPAPIYESEELSTVVTTEETTLTSTPVKTTPVKKDSAPAATPVKVQVDEEVETSGNVAIKTMHVKVELPLGVSGEPPSAESTEAMLARAREMVEEAKKLETAPSAVSKRKVEEDDEELDEEEQDRRAKKSKIVEDQLRKEKVKTRALIGLTASLALGALLPYFM